MTEKIIEIEAETLEEAREQVKYLKASTYFQSKLSQMESLKP